MAPAWCIHDISDPAPLRIGWGSPDRPRRTLRTVRRSVPVRGGHQMKGGGRAVTVGRDGTGGVPRDRRPAGGAPREPGGTGGVLILTITGETGERMGNTG